MSTELLQLVGLLLAGGVVLLGARSELTRVSWGPTAWKVMLVAFVIVAVVAAVLLFRRAPEPLPAAPAGVGEGIQT